MVDPKTGKVTESWTGYQVAWEMARGYSGEFAHSLNSPFIWLPLCAFFLVGLFDWRRWRRIANLDLLVLLGFGVSHFFFNQGNIGVSVPLAYPVLRLPAGALPVDRVPRPRRRAAAGLADDVAADRGALPDGLPGRAEHGRRGGDRRRLRGRHRRPPDRPRRTALRRLPGGHPLRRHLRPGQLRRLRPVRGDLALHRRMGRPARRPRRLDHLRHRHLHPADRPRHPDPPGTVGQPPRRDPRLRLGRLPLHRLRPRVRLQRRAGRRLTGGDPGPA